MKIVNLVGFLWLACLTVGAATHASAPPRFNGPTPGTLRTISIPLVDLSGDMKRQVVVARGTPTTYQGHCDTALMGDGKTMYAAWCMNHAGHLGPLSRSDDQGMTWSEPLPVPSNWKDVKLTTPVLHQLTDPQGVERIFIFGGCDFPGNLRRAFSEDGGRTWSPMEELGLVGEVPPKSILSFDGKRKLVMWSDRRDPKNAKDPAPVVWQSESLDGGLTWGKERVILEVPGQWAQPSVIRSADGKKLLMLLRENTRKHHSLYSVSEDDARTWSEPLELPAALTGDRHVIKRVRDGRLVVAFRDMAKTSATYGHYVAWVGTFEDIVERREGGYRIKLLHNSRRKATDKPGEGNSDCGYSDLELLPDDTVVATTYIQYASGDGGNSVVSTRFNLAETDALVGKQPAKGTPGSLLSAGWDPVRAGQEVLGRLVSVSAPKVKGAHDAEFVCVGNRAYVVSEANDVRAGESGDWPFIYSTMSIVDLPSLRVERTVDFAREHQVFANETLPAGACWVPRILQKDANALRCYFVSQSPGHRPSQMWYRDFDLRTGLFAETIHKAKLQTSMGTFDFQPQHFYADAVAQGFSKKASDSFFFIFDSFKRFEGGLYVALNNFTGGQNALSRVHEDLETFEIVGHYNEPQSAQLSESSVNRLPDGTWMAICRNDRGNYHFTTSADGRRWTTGRELETVRNGANSKPTFDRFGGVYYLGWQEATRVEGVSRSVFNVDVSRDGKSWERKYRFESTKSFQYPTFHEHQGAIWLCVTQGDQDASRKERIMFGKLEKLDVSGSKGDQR